MVSPFTHARRVVELWAAYARLDYLLLSRDPRAFILFAFADFLVAMSGVSAMLILAARLEQIGIWSGPRIVFLVGYAALVNGLLDLLFGYNVRYLSRRIGRGQLDHLLLQPQPLWRALLTDGFVPFSSASVLVPGLVLVGGSLAAGAATTDGWWWATFLVQLIASLVVGLAFIVAWSSLAFWAPVAGEELAPAADRLLQHLSPYPMEMVGSVLRVVLFSAAPAALIAWHPARVLLGLERDPAAVLVVPLAAFAATAVAVTLFRLGLRQQRRHGTGRYLAHGHRR